MSGLPPYRERALAHYAQQGQTVVVPRLISLRLVGYLWAMLAVLLAAVVVSWFGRIPTFTAASGIVLGQMSGQTVEGLYIFLPAGQSRHVRAGQSVQVHVGSNGPTFTTTIEHVGTDVMTPATARQHFNLGSSAWGVIREPSLVIKIRSMPQISLQAFAGSSIDVRLQIGSRPMFALLPGISQLVEDT
ncbi:hypothetical protein KDA_65690 [Dictyobacter alpinus]|uniref:Uncharacterized protein n=1 Tax=Dictyobacter alpinus TaxID=2014873 RepID=A0A402BI93_9CHLR|nr:hypothetical protein [Dictyobacter alpinus]GCE31085.1 hypothetical protein KDA_65690 [Dictyobacter alpinus]